MTFIAWFKIGLLAIAGLAVASIIGLGYHHYTGLVAANATLRANAEKLELALSVERTGKVHAEDRVREFVEAQKRAEAALAEFVRAQREAEQEARKINEQLAKHDLGRLGRAHPTLVERAINAGAERARRSLREHSTAR